MGALLRAYATYVSLLLTPPPPPLPSELRPQFATAKRGRREKKEQGAHSYVPKWPGSVVAEPGLKSQNHIHINK